MPVMMPRRKVNIHGHDVSVEMDVAELAKNITNLLFHFGNDDHRHLVLPALLHNLRLAAIHLLEDDLGLKVKVCGNCDRFIAGSLAHYGRGGSCQQICLLSDPGPKDWERPNWEIDGPFATGCKHWEPKEVSKKK